MPQFSLSPCPSANQEPLCFIFPLFFVLLNFRGEFLKMVSFSSWGWWLIGVGSLSFVGFLYAAVISKLLPLSDNPIISAIQNDRYYCFLVPLTLPILFVAVYFHWLSMKLFKHA